MNAIEPFKTLIEGYLPRTDVESLPPDDNSLPRDTVTYALTIRNPDHPDDVHQTQTVTIYHQSGSPTAYSEDFDRAMREHDPPLLRRLIPLGNHYEIVYMTNWDWNQYQETYSAIVISRPTREQSLTMGAGTVAASNPVLGSPRAFNFIHWTKDFDVPVAAHDHLRRTEVSLSPVGGGGLAANGFLATNTAAVEFLESRGYVCVGSGTEGGRDYPLYLAPLDASLYSRTLAPI